MIGVAENQYFSCVQVAEDELSHENVFRQDDIYSFPLLTARLEGFLQIKSLETVLVAGCLLFVGDVVDLAEDVEHSSQDATSMLLPDKVHWRELAPSPLSCVKDTSSIE